MIIKDVKVTRSIHMLDMYRRKRKDWEIINNYFNHIITINIIISSILVVTFFFYAKQNRSIYELQWDMMDKHLVHHNPLFSEILLWNFSIQKNKPLLYRYRYAKNKSSIFFFKRFDSWSVNLNLYYFCQCGFWYIART